jgi:hypothetical protein
MSEIRVIAYLNMKNWMFSIEALEGPDMGRVIAHVEKLALRKATFSNDKRKVGGVLGLWDSRLRAADAERNIFGHDENAYNGLPIKFDFNMGKYIEDDLHRVLQDREDIFIHIDLEKDDSFKLIIKQKEMDLLYLHADEDSQDITGFYCNWKRVFNETRPKTLKKGE